MPMACNKQSTSPMLYNQANLSGRSIRIEVFTSDYCQFFMLLIAKSNDVAIRLGVP